MTKFSNKLKKPCFWSILGPENPAFSCTTSHKILAPCQNFEKINGTILDRQTGQSPGQTERLKDRWKDGRTYSIL